MWNWAGLSKEQGKWPGYDACSLVPRFPGNLQVKKHRVANGVFLRRAACNAKKVLTDKWRIFLFYQGFIPQKKCN
jgi:hypothetical protein